MKYAVTQLEHGGPFVPTNLDLERCWYLDLRRDTNHRLLHENGHRHDSILLDSLDEVCELANDVDPDELIEAVNTLYDRTVEYIIERIQADVFARGWYVQDGKITKEEERRMSRD